jgi:RimJ/RimL family protein N-acetyltransferase
MEANQEVIQLRPFTEADIDRLISWIPSAEFLLQWAGPSYSFPLTQEQIGELLALATADEPPVMLFKAVDPVSGQVIGHIELLNIDRTNRSVTVGRVLVGPVEQRGHGVGRQIVAAALKIAFEELALHRVGLGVFDFNTAAIACYERVGFRREGALRDYRRIGGDYWTLIMMSILEDEWRSTAGLPVDEPGQTTGT